MEKSKYRAVSFKKGEYYKKGHRVNYYSNEQSFINYHVKLMREKSKNYRTMVYVLTNGKFKYKGTY